MARPALNLMLVKVLLEISRTKHILSTFFSVGKGVGSPISASNPSCVPQPSLTPVDIPHGVVTQSKDGVRSSIGGAPEPRKLETRHGTSQNGSAASESRMGTLGGSSSL